MRILVLGVSGMLGSAMYRTLSESADLEVWGSVRSSGAKRYFAESLRDRILAGVDMENMDSLSSLFERVRPQVVVNCVGLVKQLVESNDPLVALPINAMLPHRLSRYCALVGARLVHFSTDCVFSGKHGGYRESDVSDAQDLYGKSKFIGEVSDDAHALTLRTSIIGHELASHHGLVEWFLHQEGSVRGYRRVVFSGLPTVELSRVVRDVVIPQAGLSGVHHVASAPITKHDLLELVAKAYGKATRIEPDDSVVIDRSLVADQFRDLTGYVAPDWPELVRRMKNFS
ncbi:MAG: SDR family oxidoreductase [Zoogloeaceae bacterium]|mgnify:CR=1 FL=1|uniref:dTDP-4-dehydrorhamnose reductase family protein n=1 Tax=Denitromonas sp. TaxID=2734609 RepID=UPI001D66F11F|nr:SDR family oxidoreductase [Rhodocyclaceae bacterium]MCP5222738.1 SDR family oxidoreductase [Zoogloeaceae bacterium]